MVHLFIYFLLSANHEEGNWQGVVIKRGQFITGRVQIERETGIKQQSIRTCIKRLKSTSEITVKATSKYSIITLLNYDKYQIQKNKSTSKSTSQLTNNQPATNQQLTTTKNEKNEKNEKERGGTCRFAPPSLKEIQEYIQSKGYGVNAERFFNHYESNGWMVGKNKMKKWQAAIGKWESSDKPATNNERIL